MIHFLILYCSHLFFFGYTLFVMICFSKLKIEADREIFRMASVTFKQEQNQHVINRLPTRLNTSNYLFWSTTSIQRKLWKLFIVTSAKHTLGVKIERNYQSIKFFSKFSFGKAQIELKQTIENEAIYQNI